MGSRTSLTRTTDQELQNARTKGQLIGWIQEARKAAAGIVVNAGAYTHTSVAILDALMASEKPVIEVHLSNVFRREPFRHHSYVSPAAIGVIAGCGPLGYGFALEALARQIRGTRRKVR